MILLTKFLSPFPICPKNIITNIYVWQFFMIFTNYLFNFLDTNFSTSKSRIVPASTINLCPVLVKTICTCERTSSCEKKGSRFCSFYWGFVIGEDSFIWNPPQPSVSSSGWTPITTTFFILSIPQVHGSSLQEGQYTFLVAQ